MEAPGWYISTSCSSSILVITIIGIKDFYFIYYQNGSSTDSLQIFLWWHIFTVEYSTKPKAIIDCITWCRGKVQKILSIDTRGWSYSSLTSPTFTPCEIVSVSYKQCANRCRRTNGCLSSSQRTGSLIYVHFSR